MADDSHIYEIGNPVMTGSPDKLEIGSTHPITHAATGITLAWYRVELVEPERNNFNFWMIYGRICEEPIRIDMPQDTTIALTELNSSCTETEL